MGKTSIVLAAIKTLLHDKKAKKILIIAPLRVCYLVWPGEIEKWKDFNKITYSILHGKNKQEALNKKADIYLINPEGLEWLLGVTKRKTAKGKVAITVDLKTFKKFGFDTLVVDELTKFKRSSSQRFAALKHVLHLFKYRWGLTGSPASNGLIDLFGQCYILDQGVSLGRFITHYRNTYFDKDHDGFSWVPRAGSDERIYDKIRPICMRLDAEEYLEMPIVHYNELLVELPDNSKAFYQELEDEFIAEINGNTIVARNAAAASIKCRQIASGGIYRTPSLEEMFAEGKVKREWIEVHTQKLEALEDLYESLQGQPLLVAYEFEHDLARLKRHFGEDTPNIGKGVKMSDTKVIEANWNAGKIPLMFGQPQSMGHGLNLQGDCYHVAWFTPTWDLELFDQFNRRVWRRGNKHKHVFIHIILAKNTVDRFVAMALRSKTSVQKALFDALKK